MVKRPGGGEFFQMVDGVPSDIDLHQAWLGADDKHTINPMDPRQAAEVIAATKARVERRRRGEAAAEAKKRR